MSQIAINTRSNDLYAAPGRERHRRNVGQPAQPSDAGGHPRHGPDPRGNSNSDGTSAYTYSSENQLLTGPDTVLIYDPLMRLYQGDGSWRGAPRRL